MEQNAPRDILKEVIYMCDHKHKIKLIGEVRYNDQTIRYTFTFFDILGSRNYYHQSNNLEGLDRDQAVIALWKRIEKLISVHNEMVLEREYY